MKLTNIQRDSIHATIANFLAEIAEEYDSYPEHLQEQIGEEYVSDEAWEVVLDNIEQAINGKVFIEKEK